MKLITDAASAEIAEVRRFLGTDLTHPNEPLIESVKRALGYERNESDTGGTSAFERESQARRAARRAADAQLALMRERAEAAERHVYDLQGLLIRADAHAAQVEINIECARASLAVVTAERNALRDAAVKP